MHDQVSDYLVLATLKGASAPTEWKHLAHGFLAPDSSEKSKRAASCD